MYLYDENLKTGGTFTKHQGRQTSNFSGPMEVASILSGTPDTPITPGAPGTPGTPVTPLPLPPSEPMGSTEKIPTPFDGEKLEADAKALIDVMAGNDCMSGFHAQLQIALAPVENRWAYPVQLPECEGLAIPYRSVRQGYEGRRGGGHMMRLRRCSDSHSVPAAGRNRCGHRGP